MAVNQSSNGELQWGLEPLLKKSLFGTLPQAPLVQPQAVKPTYLPQKPKPVDPNKTPEAFKKRFIEKHGDGVAEDGRKYSQIPAPEIVVKVIRKYGDGSTTDGIPYKDFLPRAASPDDSLDYRLKQIESLYGGPKSNLYTNSTIRGATEEEKKFTDKVTRIQKEGEIMKTLKAPYRGLESVGQNLGYGAFGFGADVVDMFDGDDKNNLSSQMRRSVEQEQFKTGLTNTNKGLIGGLQSGDLSSVIQTLSSGAGYLTVGAKIPLYLTALSQGGNLSLEGEQQGQGDFGDKLTAYTAGTLSATIDRLSGQKVIGGLEKAGIKKETATTFVQKMNNYLKGLKPSDFEAGTEIIQQTIENIGRTTMGVDYDKGIQQYFEVGLLGKVLGKVGDKGFSESPVTTLPPKAPTPPKPQKYVTNNLEVLQGIRTGVKGNDIVTNAKSRGFDPETDVATYQELAPEIDKNGKVNTDNAQVNLQKHIKPLQKQLDEFIAQEGQYASAEDFRAALMQEIESEKSNIDNYPRWKKRMEEAVKNAVEEFGDEQGRIPVVEVNNIKKKNGNNSNYNNPDDSLYKAIARGAKRIVEENTNDVNVKELNNELANLYTTLSYLEVLGTGTKTAKGGKLSGYTASLSGKVVGGMIGMMGGPIIGAVGSVVGGEVASRIHGSLMENLIQKGNQKLPKSAKFEQANKDVQNKKANMLLPPASGKPLSANVVDLAPQTGFLPGTLQKDMMARGTMPNPSSEKSRLPTPKLPEGKGEQKPGKKVNEPIIQKTEVKATKLPKPKVKEAAKVDPELESLQKSQESLPGLPKVEVPSDYTPTDGLPTGTEFESTTLPIATKAKGKIPSPDVKRPQIRGIDLGFRSNMIDSLEEQGIFTDAFFAITDKPLAIKFIDYAKKKAVRAPTGGKKVDIKSLMDRAKREADLTLTPKEFSGVDGNIYLKFSIGGGGDVAVNASYADIFFKNFDDLTFKGTNEIGPVIVYSKGKDVGLIMPSRVSGTKIGDFTVGKPKTPTPKEGGLLEEAKKYKSAEEFIDSKVGSFASESDKTIFQRHGLSEKSSKQEFNNAISKEQDRLTEKYGTVMPEQSSLGKNGYNDLPDLETLRNKVISGKYTPQTRSQLTDIYNKANTPTPKEGGVTGNSYIDYFNKNEPYGPSESKFLESVKGTPEGKQFFSEIERTKMPRFTVYESQNGGIKLTLDDGYMVQGMTRKDVAERAGSYLRKTFSEDTTKWDGPKIENKIEIKKSEVDDWIEKKFGKEKKSSLPMSDKGAVKYSSALEAMQSPEYKARMAQANAKTLRVTKTSNNLYHTTKAENLDSIAKNGLKTGMKPRYEGVSSPKKISFSANEEGASYYGGPDDIMIRTKRSYKPDDLEIDYLAGGEGTYTTGKNIPPEMLEVKIKGKWIPLTEMKKSSLPMTDSKAVKYSEPMDSLASEARKYKSAEEFVKAQGKIDYREYLKSKIPDIKDISPEGVITLKDGTKGELIVGKNYDIPEISSFNLDKKGTGLGTKIIDGLKEWAVLKNGGQATIGIKRNVNSGFWSKVGFKGDKFQPGESGWKWDSRTQPDLLDKTKSQLTDIYNKANK